MFIILDIGLSTKLIFILQFIMLWWWRLKTKLCVGWLVLNVTDNFAKLAHTFYVTPLLCYDKLMCQNRVLFINMLKKKKLILLLCTQSELDLNMLENLGHIYVCWQGKYCQFIHSANFNWEIRNATAVVNCGGYQSNRIFHKSLQDPVLGTRIASSSSSNFRYRSARFVLYR